MNERKKHFLIRLRSEGLCFICLSLRDKGEASKSQVNGGQLPFTSSTPTTFRLRSVIRFLGIDTEEILKSYLSPELSKCGDVKVELCEKCSELVAKVNSLYQTMEVTRIKLEDCVRRMHHLIGEAERDDERVEEVKQRVTNVTAAGVLKGLRKGVYEKCSRRLERAMPRVVLDPIRPAKVTNVVSNPRRAEEVQVKVENEFHEEDPAMPVLAPFEGDHSQGSGPLRLKILRRPKSLNHPSNILQRRFFKSNSGRPKGSGEKKLYHCQYCKTYKSFGSSGLNRRRHMVIVHCHHFFKDHKLPGISDVVFERLVPQLLFKDLLLIKENRCQCPLCPRSFTYSSRVHFSTLKLHLIEKHYEVLLPKLMKLQRDPDLERKLEECPSRRKARSLEKSLVQISKPTCPHCKIAFPDNGWNLRLHFANYHLEKLFEPEENYKAAFLNSFQFKQVLYHFLFQGFSSGSASKCPCCSKAFANPKNHQQQLKVHLTIHHHNFLEQRLQELQADPELNQKLSSTPPGHVCKCGAYSKTLQTLKLHERRFCNLLDTSRVGVREGHPPVPGAIEMDDSGGYAGENGRGPGVTNEENETAGVRVGVGEVPMEVCNFSQFEQNNEDEIGFMEEDTKLFPDIAVNAVPKSGS